MKQKNKDYLFYSTTTSLCPECLKKVPAKIIIKDNSVFMKKRCKESVFLKKINLPYLLILIVTMLFSLTTRVIGIFGLYYLIKNRTWMPYGFFLIGILLLFTAAYLYLGQSRFRVPLEPILMLFTVFGIIYLKRKDDKYK